MTLTCLLAAGCFVAPPQYDVTAAMALLERARTAVRDGRYDSLERLFSQERYAGSIREIARDGRALRALEVSAFPAPKGLEKFGDYWVIFHKYQGIQAGHDRIHPMVRTGDGLALGAEIPEDIATPYEITHHDFKVKLNPTVPNAEFVVTSTLKRSVGQGSVLLRMNDLYEITGAKYNGEAIKTYVNSALDQIALTDQQPELVRAGGAIVLTNAGSGGNLELSYRGQMDIAGADETTATSMLFTAGWYPHIGRGTATATSQVTGPKDWLIMAVGNITGEAVVGDEKTVTFNNPVAVAFYHLVGGPYRLAAETEDRGRKFRAWHLTKGNTERAKGDVESARNAVAFFEDRYGKFPYDHYDVIDTPDFYGIEAYSFTLLSPSITSWATSHEIGHTWFGGMVPNTYIKSIWNESLTQYIDSSVLKKNSDRSLNNGYASRTMPAALADAFLPHGPYGNVGYYRGAYVMKMLENQIGEAEMTKALRDLVKNRTGKKTEWSDIAASFRASTRQDLDWFFEQWVFGKQFPALAITRAFAEAGPRGGFVTTVDIAQSGTPKPFRQKVGVVLSGRSGEKVHVVEISKATTTFYLESDARTTRVSLDPFGYTLASVPPAKPIDEAGIVAACPHTSRS
jgi:aminopeptidase N